jgi:hypothetical protein
MLLINQAVAPVIVVVLVLVVATRNAHQNS